MKVVVTSDMHCGDPTCSLVARTGPKGEYQAGLKFGDFIRAAGKGIDYLVLLGDVFDFSIVSYKEAYEAARAFFVELNKAKIAKEILFVPGNHDFAFWHIVMHEANIINRVKDLDELKMRWSSPAILDDRPKAPSAGLTLPYVRPKTGNPKYGGLFLDYLTIDTQGASMLTFNVAYPNMYLITEDEECILLTHGQYFEDYWAFIGEIGREIVGTDLKYAGGNAMNIEDLTSINFPLNELASSGIGQAGNLTTLVRAVQSEVKKNDLKRTTRYLNNLQSYLDQQLQYAWYKQYMEWITDEILKKVKQMVIDKLASIIPTQGSKGFLDQTGVSKRVEAFLVACTQEIDALNNFQSKHYPFKFNLPAISRMVFGHTHDVIPTASANPLVWGALPRVMNKANGQQVFICNTGGWLSSYPIPTGPIGAGFWTYETGKGIRFEVV